MQSYPHQEIHTLLQGISDGFVVMDKEWDIQWCNSAFERIVGIEQIQPNLHNFRKLSESIEGLDIGRQIKKAIDTQKSQRHEVYLPLKNERYSLSIFPSVNNIFVSFQDIQQNELPHENLLIDEQNLRILIDIIEQPVWLVDTSCHILLCNEAFKKWIAHFIDVPLDKGDNVLAAELGTAYLNKFKMCYELALSGKTFNTVEDMMVDGEMKFSTISFNPVFDNDNKLTGISCHASDITDQRKKLTHLDAQTQLLMEIANIQSHTVRGPVATLLGLVLVFDFDDMANPDNAEVIRGIATVTKSLDVIVTEVIRNINNLNKHTRELR